MGEQLSQLAGGISNGVGSFAQGAANLGSEALSGIEGAVGSGINGLEGLFGGGTSSGTSGPTGQPLSGTPGATAAVTSQSAPTPSGGLSAAGLASALPNVDGSDPLSSIISQANGAAPDNPVPVTPVQETQLQPFTSPTGNPITAPAASPAQTAIQAITNPSQWTPKGVGETLLAANVANSFINPIGKGTLKSEQALATNEANLAKQQQPLVDAEQQGKLPAGAQALIDQQLKAKQAAIRQNYAQMGLSGSSAERQDLDNAQQEALALQFQQGQQMAQTGLSEISSETGLQSNLLNEILNTQVQRGTQMGDALAALAGVGVRPQTTQTT